MKQHLVIVVSLALIANSNCGLLDGILDTVKDTTSSLTHGVGGALHHGKTFIFGGTAQNAGIVGTISHKVHDVSQAVKEEVRTVIHMFDGGYVHGNGIIGRLFDRVKNRVFFHGPAEIGYEKKLNKDTVFLQHHLNKYFVNNDTSATSSIRQTRKNLQEALNRIRLNIIKKRHESGKVNSDGTGLIDIRTSANNLGGLQNDFESGVDAAYDKVNFAVDEGQQTAQSTFNGAKQNRDDYLENERINIQNNFNQMVNNGDRFKTDLSSFINGNIESQRRNVQGHYNQLSNNSDRFRSDLGSFINDKYENIENQRRNIQGHYNKLSNNGDRLRTDVSTSINDNIENQRRYVQNHYNQMATNADSLRSDVNYDIENQRRYVQNHYNQMATNANILRSGVGQSVNYNIENQRRNVQGHYNQLSNNGASMVDLESQRNLGRGY